MLRFKLALGFTTGVVMLAALDNTAVAQLAEDPATTRYEVAPQGNEARYRIREQLFGVEFPNDAVGMTRQIEGAIVFTAAGTIVKEDSSFRIDLASLKSDQDRRDGYVRRNTLQTEQYPSATFVPHKLNGLQFPLVKKGDVKFQMVGDLTVRGVTRPVTWDVTAKVTDGAITGEATTKFTFTDFEMEKPRVRSVLSVEDDIRLEYTFFLVAR